MQHKRYYVAPYPGVAFWETARGKTFATRVKKGDRLPPYTARPGHDRLIGLVRGLPGARPRGQPLPP